MTPDPEIVMRLVIANNVCLEIGRGSLEFAKWCISPYVGPRDYERVATIHEELAAEYRRETRDKLAKDVRAQNDAAESKQLTEKAANVDGDFKEAGRATNTSGDTLEETRNLGGWLFNFALPRKLVKMKDSD